MDVVLGQTRQKRQKLRGRRREKKEHYFHAVREAEQRLGKAKAWEHRPKPVVDVKPPRDETDRSRMIERLGLMYDIKHFAIETDSTRRLTFFDTGMNAELAIRGVDTDYHMLSHHGKNPDKITQLSIVETEVMKGRSWAARLSPGLGEPCRRLAPRARSRT